MTRGVKLEYTADDLRVAVAKSKSWRGVMRELGYATTSGRHSARLQAHAKELGIDLSHFRGTFTDDQLRAAVTASGNWSSVMVALGKTPGRGISTVKDAARRLGLDTSHFIHKQSFIPVPGVTLPFSDVLKPGGQSGLSIAAKWFLDRGYVVSVPLEPTSYDLITESNDGLKRVQVKTTRRTEPNNGRYVVRIARKAYDATTPPNAGGCRKHVPYTADQIDFFFVIAPNAMFLIPIDSVVGLTSLNLDEKYAAFAV